MSGIADYNGRTVDLLAWAWPGSISGQLSPNLALPGYDGAVVTGISKLVQRFLLELLTEQGSMLYSPTRGCQFMLYLRNGLIRTALEAEQLFYSALIDISRNLVADEVATDPDDERFAGASLINVGLSPDTLSISVYVVSRAGTSRAVILPLPTTITGG